MLDTNLIKEIPFREYQKDFTFVVNGQEYPTNRIIADILSPIIRQYHLTDKTIDHFYINTLNKNDQTSFSKILSLITFQPQTLTEEEVKYFIEIFTILGNQKELYKLIHQNTEEITLKNVFSLIQVKQKYFNQFQSKNNSNQPDNFYIDFKFLIQKELEFISSHFYEIDKEKVQNLDANLIEEIIKSDKLELEDEDSLINLINGIYLKDPKLSYLYSYVDFMLISIESLQHFSEIFELNDITSEIWNSILNRSLNSKPPEKANKKYKMKGIPLLYKKGDDFNGIIKYLTEKTGGNIHNNGTIQTTASSCQNGCEPKNLLDFNYNAYYQAGQFNNDWIMFDFKNRKVNLTNYSIKSNSTSKNGSNLKSWAIEISEDGKTWTKIDEQKNCEAINGSRLTGTFEVKPNKFSRYIRLLQTDKNWSGNYFWFYYIEFYGYLLE